MARKWSQWFQSIKRNTITQKNFRNWRLNYSSFTFKKLFGVQIDDKLNLNLQSTNIYRSAASQLNALISLKRLLSFEANKVLVNSYFYSNINYCSLFWSFFIAKSWNKIQSLQKRALCQQYGDYEWPYDTLLAKLNKVTVKAD